MSQELKNVIHASAEEIQYDEKAKQILAQKGFLSQILVRTIDEFKGLQPNQVVPLIEGEPYVGVVPVEPGMTNVVIGEDDGEKIYGINNENSEINESLIRFDIIFYVRLKDGLSQMIINIEAQKEEPSAYNLLNRGIFYVSRMISSQKGRDFKKSNYNDIKAVYSIWICMNMEENCQEKIHLIREQMVGTHQWAGNIDLINIIMIGIRNNPPEKDENYELHRLIGTIFSRDLTEQEKIDIFEQEYDIDCNPDVRSEVRVMCNLSQGIREDGIREGYSQGLEQGIEQGVEQGYKQGVAQEKIQTVLNMHKKKYTVEEIISIAELPLEKVQEIIEQSMASV